jgi:hypothetical protein
MKTIIGKRRLSGSAFNNFRIRSVLFAVSRCVKYPTEKPTLVTGKMRPVADVRK